MSARVRAHTLPPVRTVSGLEALRASRRYTDAVLAEYDRPRTRGDCVHARRPCPFVSCKYHLFLDVNEHTGALKLNFPHLEVWELLESCALDIADRGSRSRRGTADDVGATLEEAASAINITREALRLVERKALRRLRLQERIDTSRDREVWDWSGAVALEPAPVVLGECCEPGRLRHRRRQEVRP